MECAYALADLVVSRSGASSLTELAAFGLPAVLIPYPFAADDHQTVNASVFVDREAAVMIKQEDITPEEFSRVLGDLLEDDERRKAIGAAAKGLAVPSAAENICEHIEKTCLKT